MTLFFFAVALLFAGAALAVVTARSPRLCTAIAALFAVVGCAGGAVFSFRVLGGASVADVSFAWRVPYGGIVVGCDALSAFFLVPVFVLGAVTAVYGRAYLLAYAGKKSLGVAAGALNLLVASMAMVVVARHGLLFLVAWEIMSLAAYLLVVFEHEQDEVRRAGWVYLVATHAGTTLLVAVFILLGRRAGSLDFSAFDATSLGPVVSGVVFVCALVGFGVKAGLVPVHVWLPEAHAAAPSHVSALMSAVLVKMGVYGVLRTMTLLGSPASWWGPLLVVVGVVGGLFGISLALYQRDMKRCLAYSTVENVGIVMLGVGVGTWARARGLHEIAALALLGALLHVWNHSLMKGLMFLSAGSVLHGAGTKDLERLGGLMGRMPRTATLMTVGAVAIAGLPPMNGFVGEWLIYRGLIRGGLHSTSGTSVSLLLAVGALAMIGGLAALCFVRLVGVGLLGQARSEGARKAHESPTWMTGSMALLAAACLFVAVVPAIPLASASTVAQKWASVRADALEAVADSAKMLGVAQACVLVIVFVVAAAVARSIRVRKIERAPTWGCGYVAPTPRIQYTARSFSEIISERLLPRPLRARVVVDPPVGVFPSAAKLASTYEDPVMRGVYEPSLRRSADRFARLYWMQRGALHLYILYILVAVVGALTWVTIRAWWGGG